MVVHIDFASPSTSGKTMMLLISLFFPRKAYANCGADRLSRKSAEETPPWRTKKYVFVGHPSSAFAICCAASLDCVMATSSVGTFKLRRLALYKGGARRDALGRGEEEQRGCVSKGESRRQSCQGEGGDEGFRHDAAMDDRGAVVAIVQLQGRGPVQQIPAPWR